MLDDALKKEIQGAYTELLNNKGYVARHCQKTMIAEIARTLGSAVSRPGRCCVIEAGTGTGKTIAYAIAAIPIARRMKKKIVIATATVALQEQIMYRDLPDIREHSGLEFSFALAKGRRRYLCLAKLDAALQGPNSGPQLEDLFSGGPGGPGEGPGNEGHNGPLFEQMISRLGHGEWDGDRDAWPTEIEDVSWMRVSTDHAQCTGRQCSHYENCYFYKAREKIHRVDVIVTNHDLVLSDLVMGGGAVLPAPEDTIYIFDEGHHLPEKAGNHFAGFFSLYSSRSWLLQLPAAVAMATSGVPEMSADTASALEKASALTADRLEEAARELMAFRAEAEEVDAGWRYRFPMGRVPGAFAAMAAPVADELSKVCSYLQTMSSDLETAMEDRATAEREFLEQGLGFLSSAANRAGAAASLWRNFSQVEQDPPFARWLRFTTQGQIEGLEVQMSCHPVSVADVLTESLWSRCTGAVLTSATLSVGGDFTIFKRKSGIGDSEVFVSLPSPFRFREQATLRVPKMTTEPGDAQAHTGELAILIPDLLQNEQGSLVLFTSWRQMLRVHDEIDAAFCERVLLQGDLSKMEMIASHKRRIDAGESSCIFGLASFAEGVDLPGDYCTHVVIAKLPFSVPDDPVDATLSEWIAARGGNAFFDLMLPNAILRVVQGAGRLLRTETDRGTVSILDRRVVSKAYGRRVLDSLPPFSREIS